MEDKFRLDQTFAAYVEPENEVGCHIVRFTIATPTPLGRRPLPAAEEPTATAALTIPLPRRRSPPPPTPPCRTCSSPSTTAGECLKGRLPLLGLAVSVCVSGRSRVATMGVVALVSATVMRERRGGCLRGRGHTGDNDRALCELGNFPQTAAGGGSARPGVKTRVNVGAFYLVGMSSVFLMAFEMGMLPGIGVNCAMW